MTSRTLFVILGLLALSCATLHDQLTITTVDQCIKHNCTGQEAHAYQSCEASCRSAYGQ